MKLSTLRIDRSAVLRVVAAVILSCCGAHAATLLTATPSSVALTCSTLTGPGPAASIVVKPAAPLTNGAVAVALGAAGGGLVVTPPSPALLNSANQSQGLTFNVKLAAGCAGAATGTATLRFYAGGVADLAVAAAITVTATATALVASSVELTCTRSAGSPVVFAPGPARAALLTSAAAGGTPFTVDAATIPAWLALPPTTASSAGASGVTLVMSPVAPCGNFLAGSRNTATIHLKNPPAPDALIAIALQILGPSPLIAAPAAPSLAYTKGSATPAFVDVALTSSGSGPVSFVVDAASLPSWLSVDASSGSTPRTLRFSTTSVAEANAQGSYSATLRVQNSGFGDFALPIRLTIGNPAPRLTVAEGNTRSFSWTVGQPVPALNITLASSGAPIAYSIATGGPLGPIVGSTFLKGIAYSYATPIPVTFDESALQAATWGSAISGTVSVTWGTPAATTVITINATVQAAGATLLAVNPPSLPTAAPGQSFIVALTGTGFVASTDPAQATTVGIVSGGSLTADPNVVATVLNASNIILAITVPAAGADPLMPFGASGSGGTVTLGICNPRGTACRAPTGTVKLLITPNPVIQAVTNAAAFLQVTPVTLPAVAPYDMISLFGASFCVTGGTGCTDGQVLYGTPDPAILRYPTALSPDAPDGDQRLLTVTFQTHATPPVAIAVAPLLFATNNQINLLVPAAVAAFNGKTIDIVVSFGHAPAAVILSSAPFPVRVAAADPGIFTIGTDGHGDGAILGLDWSIIGAGNEAAMRSNPADSDVVQIYMTGLGAPDSTASNAASGNGQWPGDCVSTGSYLSTLNLKTGAGLAAVDGVLLAGTLLNGNRLPPCLSSAATIPSVTIGGQPATVMYAGWVSDSVAGQYQVNVKLPGSAAGTFVSASGTPIASPVTGAVQLPVVVTARGVASQPGVIIWVAPRLKVTGPTALQGTAGVVWPVAGSAVNASGGTPAYRYSISRGTLPAGLTLDSATGAISGMATTRGSYVLTVTATDSAASPLTGSVTFIFIVN